MGAVSTPNGHKIPGEIAMQQAWRFQLWGAGKVRTVQGHDVVILDAGKLNVGPGPDFRDARIRIDGEMWVGNIEIHRHASDWHRHGHDTDAAYDNVILHVVGDDDCRIVRGDNTEIPQTIMEIGDGFSETFNYLLNDPNYVLPMCGHTLTDVPGIFKTDWITALAFERMERKSNDVLRLLESESGNWHQTAFVVLARGLGFGTNADNMERMARSLPFKYLLRHTDRVEIVEALLFGQAGLLKETAPTDLYESELIKEYRFYAHKYGLKPIDKPLWQMNVRHTANSPYRRIALLARLVCMHGTNLGSRLCNADVAGIREYLNAPLAEYWKYSFAFGRTCANRMSALGKQSQDLLIINVIAPLTYCRGMQTGRYELMDAAIGMWQSLDSENNGIIRGFGNYGVKSQDAFTSQALIQLHREYCERRRCPECRLGFRMLASHIGFRGN